MKNQGVGYLRIFAFLFLISSIRYANANPPITLQERIACEKAIDTVYWSHEIWPAENGTHKPALDSIVPESALRIKIEEYLRKSDALASYWGRPITGADLQSEMDRMARNTQDPRLLKELWTALNFDPYRIAECLARPLLVDRISRKQAGFDAWWPAHRDQALIPETPRYSYRLPKMKAIPNATLTPVATNTWSSMTTVGAPEWDRYDHPVWTGTEMILFDYAFDTQQWKPTGARYNPATDSWSSINMSRAPSPRGFFSAIWTGSEMIVWGGLSLTSRLNLKTGARYNPISNSWSVTSTAHAPALSDHTTVWTGTELIVWGGSTNSGGATTLSTNLGGRYNPSTNKWIPTSTVGAPSTRRNHSGAWTGSEMIIWGGSEPPAVQPGEWTNLKTGGRYNPSTNTWTPTSLTGAPRERQQQVAFWTGTQMIIWGGYSNTAGDLKSGALYNPASNSWSPTSLAGAPYKFGFSSVWTGNEMIIWGGQKMNAPRVETNTGARYNPLTNRWSAATTVGAPEPRQGHHAVWTGTQMIVWGGFKDLPPAGEILFNNGGRYIP